MNHYVYRITCITTKKHYYGVRSCEVEPSKDLGKKYKSSSNVVYASIMLYGVDDHKFKIVKSLKQEQMQCHMSVFCMRNLKWIQIPDL